jgi:DNA primase
MSFSPQFLDQLRERLSLAHVIGRRVKLQKRGRDYIGLCPFHKEKTPSFNVVEDKAFYHCFGCGAHGDAIGFTMRTENLGFRETVEALAREAGVDVPEESPASRAATERAATLHEACAAGCEAYERQLWSPAGAAGLAYLRGRGLSDDLIRRFRLGWAPEGRAFLRSELGSRFSESLLVEAGLLRHGENGIFDFFRGRVIFPIFDRRGGVIAFGGRAMGDAQPKYLNSPDTPIFHKGRTLYALNLARPMIAPEAPPIVAEGYMDVIALHGAGFGTAVAPLGTALTEEHLTELWRLHAGPVICFDGDAAGQRAAVRTLDRALPLLQSDKSLRFLRLPEKHDPDSLIREAGPEAFRKLVERPRILSDFLWESAARKRKEWSPEQIAELETGLKRRLQTVPDRTLQQHLLSDVRTRAADLFYAQVRARRTAKRGKAASPQLEATLTDSYRDWKLAALLLVGIVNHPAIAHADIDRLVMIGTRDGGLMRLFEAIMQEFSETPDCDRDGLLARITASGCEEQLQAIEKSDFYLPTRSLHPGADPYDAALVWRSIFARLRLPELKAELGEIEAEFRQNASPEALDLLERRRQIVVDQNSEAELVALQREPDERWQPRAKSAA